MDKKRLEEAIKILDKISNSVKESSEIGQALETALVVLEQEHAKEADEQWKCFKENFVFPAVIHLAELENNYLKKGAKTMNEAWKNFSKKCIESYDALQTLKANGMIDEEEKAKNEHRLLVDILNLMKTEVDD